MLCEQILKGLSVYSYISWIWQYLPPLGLTPTCICHAPLFFFLAPLLRIQNLEAGHAKRLLATAGGVGPKEIAPAHHRTPPRFLWKRGCSEARAEVCRRGRLQRLPAECRWRSCLSHALMSITSSFRQPYCGCWSPAGWRRASCWLSCPNWMEPVQFASPGWVWADNWFGLLLRDEIPASGAI